MKQSNNTTNSSTTTTDWPTPVIMSELMAQRFPPPAWLIPGIIPKGLTILGGKPKVGKSFFALEMSLAIAAGSYAFGSENHPCEQGEVLYCAIEDFLPRLQMRIKGLLNMGAARHTDEFTAVEQLPKIGEGGIEYFEAHCKAHPDTKLIVVDVLSKFRSFSGKQRGTIYDQEYAELSPLQEFTLQNNVSVLLVHHLTKRENPDDVFDEISGSTALGGVPETLMVLKRVGNNATLHVRGKNMPEQQLGFVSKVDDDMCSWQLVGEVPEQQVSVERQDIIDLLTESAAPLSPKDIAEKLDKPGANTRKLLSRMVKQQDPAIERIDGKYTIAGISHSGHRVTPNDIDPSHSGHNGHSSKMVKVDGHNTGHTYNHGEPSDSKCSDQSVTGVIAVTGTVDQDLIAALEQVPLANYRQKIEGALGNGMSKEEAIEAAEMVRNGSLYIASDLLSKYPEPEPQEGEEGSEDMLW